MKLVRVVALPAIAIFLAAPTISQAASVVQTASCTASAPGGAVSSTVTVTSTNRDENSCLNDDYGTYSMANSSSTLTLRANELTLFSAASVLSGGIAIGSTGSSSAFVQTTVQIGTEGPIRDGVVVGEFDTGFLRNGAVGYGTVSVNPDYFAPNFSIAFGYPRTVQLGIPLTFIVTDFAMGIASALSEVAGGGPSSSLFLDFFEKDGTTPVAIADVPEPRWVLASGLGLGILAIFRRRERFHQ